MSDWQSEREDYLAGGYSDSNGCGSCLVIIGLIALALIVAGAVLYYSINYQLSK